MGLVECCLDTNLHCTYCPDMCISQPLVQAYGHVRLQESGIVACTTKGAGCDFATCMCRNRGAAESNSFLAQLEAKYAKLTATKQNGKGKSRGGSSLQQEQEGLTEPSDAQFEAARCASLADCMQTAPQSFLTSG